MKKENLKIGDSIRKAMDDELREGNSQAPTDEEPKVTRKPRTGRPKKGKVVNSRYVRVYKGPSTSWPLVTTMKIGERATILDKLPGYYKIQTEKGDYVGYVSSNYFEEV